MNVELSAEQIADMRQMFDEYRSLVNDKIYEYQKIQLESHVKDYKELLVKSIELENNILGSTN